MEVHWRLIWEEAKLLEEQTYVLWGSDGSNKLRAYKHADVPISLLWSTHGGKEKVGLLSITFFGQNDANKSKYRLGKWDKGGLGI